jgi:2,4-dienoyl-CoA reductase-like NADH-dependent reductase (Old Yellow Enzyme family)
MTKIRLKQTLKGKINHEYSIFKQHHQHHEVAERLMTEGVADYISMCRPFIREPGLINRWKNGDRRRAACLSDNQCFAPASEGKGIYCVVEERERAKKKGEQK